MAYTSLYTYIFPDQVSQCLGSNPDGKLETCRLTRASATIEIWNTKLHLKAAFASG